MISFSNNYEHLVQNSCSTYIQKLFFLSNNFQVGTGKTAHQSRACPVLSEEPSLIPSNQTL